MSISAKQIKHLASLARLSLTDKEIVQYRREISGIVRYVDEIASVNVSNLEPTTRLTKASGLREDSAMPWDTTERETALGSAPRRKGRQVVVPRVFSKL